MEAVVEATGHTSWLLWEWDAAASMSRYISKASTPFPISVSRYPSYDSTWPSADFVGMTILYFSLATAMHYLTTSRNAHFATTPPELLSHRKEQQHEPALRPPTQHK